ncbi:methyl-accepting chemotaxis protein [Neoroseomonas rubea]|uniref:methyl-accepting chemotaxis protein n=1 Tax=Neoroseomonas rubea TaxID=2748666 RepID=UPI0018E00EF7|nr:methyl-accepting chemotaxis protein [Roseomonas rubea]
MSHLLRRLTPRMAAREVAGLVTMLALLALGITAAWAFASWRSLDAGARIATVNRHAAALFQAMDGIQLERGRMQNALRAQAPVDAPRLAQITEPRASSQAVAASALDGLADGASPALLDRIGAARRALERLDGTRAAADQALRQPRPQRPEALLRDWYGIATAAGAALNAVWLEASGIAAADAILARAIETAYLAHQAREDAGVERAGLSGFVGEPAQANPDRLAGWAMRRGAVQSAFRRIEELNPASSASPAVTAAISAARDSYFGRFVPVRDQMVAAATTGRAPPMGISEWQALGDRGLASVLSIRDAALHDAERHLAARQASARAQLTLDAVLVLLVLAIAGITLLRLSQRVLSPLRGITAALERIGRGEARPDLPRVWRGDDEMGGIVGAVRGIGEQMEQRAQAEADERAAAARQAERVARLEALVAAFEADAERALGTVAAAAEALDGTAAVLEGAAREGMTLTGAVAGAADETAGNTQVAAAAAEELTSSVAEIARQVTQATEVARRAVAEAVRTDETMQGLSVAAERIGEVVSLISGIAAQTNLLALNATIEAARAGDAGKGFAVVASEVKSLAGQTAKATAEIGQQIANMRSVAVTAVETVRGIGAVVGEINDAAASIAAAVEEQGAATAEIARSVADVARSTGTVSHDTRAASGAAQKTGELSGQVRSASLAFAEEASRLRARIGEFLGGVRAA